MQARTKDNAGYPDKRVATAILQAYLASKDSGIFNWAKGWGLNFNEEKMDLTLPAAGSTAREKFDTCGNILNKISHAGNDFDNWVKLLQQTYAIAADERKYAGLLSSTGLAETMDALRDYVLGELTQLQAFAELKSQTDKELSSLYQQIEDREKREGFDKKELEGEDGLYAKRDAKKIENEALNSVADKHSKEQFFKSWISATQAATELNEKTFNDFAEKVRSNEHLLNLASATLAEYNKHNATGTVLGKPQTAVRPKATTSRSEEQTKSTDTPKVSATHGTLLGRAQTGRSTISSKQRRKLRQAQNGTKTTRSGLTYGK